MAELLICLGVLAATLELARRNLHWAVTAICGLLPIYLIRASVPFPVIHRLPTTALEVALLTLIGVWLWKRGREPEAWRPFRSWLGPVSVFIIGALIGTLVSPDLRAALGILRAYFIEPILFFAVFLDVARTKSEATRPLAALAVSLTAIGIVAVFQKITGYGIPNPVWQVAETRRVTAFYGYPNAIGLFAAPLVTLLFGQAWSLMENKEAKKAFLPALASLLGVLGIVFAVSQGAMLGVACGLFLLGLMNRTLRLPALTLAAVAMATVLAVTPLRDKAVSLVSLADDSGSVRQIIWGETMSMMADRPVMGAGLSGYQHWYAPYHQAEHIEIFMYPHSLPLNFWAEIGVVGLIGFLWIIWRFTRRSFASWRKRGFWIGGAAACAMITLLVHGLVDVPYFKNDLAILFWIVVALGTLPDHHPEPENKPEDR